MNHQLNLRDKVVRENQQIPVDLFNFMTKACVEFGIRFNSRTEFENMLKAVQYFLTCTPQGNSLLMHNLKESVDAKTIMLALGLTVDKADKFCKYYPQGKLNDESKMLDYDYISEVHGWLYQGRILRSEMIETDDVPDEGQCESCGGTFPVEYCLSDERMYVGGRDRLVSLCNYCRLKSEDGRLRDTATHHTCTECKKDNCQFNPNRSEHKYQIQYLNQGAV